MRKLVLLLCCISLLSFTGCNAQKDVTEYNIADVEAVDVPFGEIDIGHDHQHGTHHRSRDPKPTPDTVEYPKDRRQYGDHKNRHIKMSNADKFEQAA